MCEQRLCIVWLWRLSRRGSWELRSAENCNTLIVWRFKKGKHPFLCFIRNYEDTIPIWEVDRPADALLNVCSILTKEARLLKQGFRRLILSLTSGDLLYTPWRTTTTTVGFSFYDNNPLLQTHCSVYHQNVFWWCSPGEQHVCKFDIVCIPWSYLQLTKGIISCPCSKFSIKE